MSSGGDSSGTEQQFFNPLFDFDRLEKRAGLSIIHETNELPQARANSLSLGSEECPRLGGAGWSNSARFSSRLSLSSILFKKKRSSCSSGEDSPTGGVQVFKKRQSVKLLLNRVLLHTHA
ncbi:hypothetical protein BASA81_003481 [Batrachochytrium salamandrivorans]|nr:hypothetical protein BASA81_003481 [Batrachochytrium salamandrivorans]